ncbi:hypothetical protein ACWDFH_29305 [Streptomyces kronopolitis]
MRVDDLSAWIRRTAFRVQDDVTGDGIADLMAIWTDGTLHLYKGDGQGGIATATTVPYGGNTWKAMSQFA